MKNKKIFYSLFLCMMMFFGISFVNAAGNATMSISGASSATINSTFTENIVVGNITGANLNGAQGVISVADTSCFTITGITKVAPGSSSNLAKGKISYLNTDDGINANTTIVTVTFQAGGSACSSSINISGIKLAFVDNSSVTPSNLTKTINITAAAPEPTKSSDATLKSLTPNTGSLSPAFASATTSYSLGTVENGTSTITFNAVPNDSKASIQSGATCTLSVGSNACNIVVKAEDGTTKTYTVNVTRKAAETTPTDPTPGKSSDATLKSLTPSAGTLSPTFSSGTTGYTMSVPEDTDTITFTAVPNDSKASIQSGTTCTLNKGSNTCNIVVKAENGSTKTYTVTVQRGEDEPEDTTPKKNSDASLKSLDISGFTLNPRFNKDTTTYSIGVSNNITGLDVTAIPTDDNATVKILGNNNWVEGVNPVKVIVTAEDGSTKTYTINVTRASSTGGIKTIDDGSTSNNYLKSLTVNNGELKPTFNKNTSNYTVVIGNQETSLDLSAIPEVDSSRVTIVGNDNLQVGVNTVTVEVTAKDGSLRVYTLNVTRSEKNADTKLKEITIGGGYDLNPKFSPDTYEYEIKVPSNVDTLDIKAIAQSTNGKVEITGNKNLKEGNNVVLLKVTDANGFTQYYRVNVEKESSGKKFLGLTLKGWLVLLGILLALGLILFLILLLLNRKKKEEETSNVNIKKSEAPVIEFKPEFNFGSKNGTDDDIVHEGGILNQYSGVAPEEVDDKPKSRKTKAAKLIESEEDEQKEIPYDPYDDIVTKDEIIDALEEARETDDDSKLKMLYAQELLNRKKEEIKAKEKRKRTSKK